MDFEKALFMHVLPMGMYPLPAEARRGYLTFRNWNHRSVLATMQEMSAEHGSSARALRVLNS